MKKLLALALIFGALSSAGNFYLAKRAYQLEAGEAVASRICSIGENINCDSALLSPYAKLFNISLSNFGLAFNLILTLLLLFFFLFGGDQWWKNISFYLAGFIALSSVLMAVISVANHLLCPVCWSLYAFSFITFIALFFAFKTERLPPISFIKQALQQKNTYILGGGLLLTSLFFHISFVNSFDIKSQKEMLSAVFSDWQYEPSVQVPSHYLLEKGPRESKITVVEFADFLCPMCKKVQPALTEFINHFPNVHFQFYVYPLDGTCNPFVNFKGSGLSCDLSKAIACANEQGKGWQAHDFIFERQSQFLSGQGEGNQKKIKALFQNMISQSEINQQKFELCMKDSATLDKIKQSAEAGDKGAIQGTPTFFVNGKKINHYSHKLLILRKIHRYLKKTAE